MPFKPVILWTDALVYLLVAVVLVLVWHIRRNEYLLVPWRRVGHSASGMAALAVLIFFVAVGLLDTVHLRPIVEHDNGGARETAYSVDVLSVLDIIATPLRTRVEKTYSAPFAAHLLDVARQVDAVVPRTERGLHPLCAVYTRACREPLARRLAAGSLPMKGLLDDVRVRVIEAEEIDVFGDRHRLLANVNTPADYAGLEALHKR